MLLSNARIALVSLTLAAVLITGCSGSGSVSDNPNAQLIEAIEVSIAQWKEREQSGQWQQMIDEGVASDDIDNDKFLKAPAKFPAFKIDQLEKKLEQLKLQSIE